MDVDMMRVIINIVPSASRSELSIRIPSKSRNTSIGMDVNPLFTDTSAGTMHRFPSSVFKALGKYLSIGSCLDRYVQVPALSRPEVDAAQPAGALFVVRGKLASKGVSRVEPSSTHYDLQLLSCAKECR